MNAIADSCPKLIAILHLIHKLVIIHPTYEAAQEWLLEDEYERVNGQLLVEEIL